MGLIKMYKYSKLHGCVINTDELPLTADSPRINTQHSSIQYTIDAIEMCGGIRNVAEALGVSTQGVSYWILKSEWGVSPNKAISLSKLTNSKITPLQLRPDIYTGYKHEQ